MILLHLGPGLANGIANLHNARRAKSPVLNISANMLRGTGMQTRRLPWTLKASPVLSRDGGERASRLKDIPSDIADAVTATRVGQVATLIVPHDFQLVECDGPPAKEVGVPFDPLIPIPLKRPPPDCERLTRWRSCSEEEPCENPV